MSGQSKIHEDQIGLFVSGQADRLHTLQSLQLYYNYFIAIGL
jgi:hypothetical protein